MSVTISALSEQDEAQRGALVERLFRGGIAVLEMLSIYVGDRPDEARPGDGRSCPSGPY